MSRFVYVIAALVAATPLYAQTDWNWPLDEEINRQTKEKQAYYKVQMGLDEYAGALSTLSWIYRNVPNLHPSIYQDGAKVIEDILKTSTDASRKLRLEDSLLWMYDQRIALFNDQSALDRKAYSAFKLYYKTPEKFPMVLAIYQELFKLDASQISEFNLTPYMTLATYYHKAKPNELTAEMVLDIHDQVSTVIEKKGTSQKEQDKVDAFLSSIGNILTCDFIEQKLVPKQKANPTDLAIAKKVFSYSIKAKCSDQPYFTDALVTLYTNAPAYNLAKALGDKYLTAEDYVNAQDYYTRAEQMTELPEEKFEALYGQAVAQSKLGNKPRARALAYEALSFQPTAEKAFNLIGNLYFTSFGECAASQSKVTDRAVYIAAYEMYKKAGNVDQMNAAKAQFPSIEDIFSENLEEGKPFTVGCWINETVTLRRR